MGSWEEPPSQWCQSSSGFDGKLDEGTSDGRVGVSAAMLVS